MGNVIKKATKETIFWVINDCLNSERSKGDTHRLLSKLFPKIMTVGRFNSWYRVVLKRREKAG